ncbi:hypothetical protein [Bradyrhizobium sp.]|uniref:hypothetical protein n=1 Tax=Bradyrhizobium sp. TaxID=376 RepID=UPI004037F795
MGYVKKAVLLTMLAMIAGLAPTMSVADEKVEGKVVSTNLTLCHPRPTGGGCEGILTLQTSAAGTTQPVSFKVIADTIIRRGQSYLVLPQTQDNSVVVTFVTEKGQKVARSIDVIGAAQ